MNTSNPDNPSIFQKMSAWQNGYRAGLAGKKPQYNAQSSQVLYESFMKGYAEGCEHRPHQTGGQAKH